MFDLTGKGALVTGASGGIGGAVAKALHGQGATVAISGTNKAKLDAVAAGLGSRVFVMPCDLRDRQAVAKLASGRRACRPCRTPSRSSPKVTSTTGSDLSCTIPM